MDGLNKDEILNAIQMVPIAERESRAARASEQIQIDFPGGEVADIHTYINRVRLLLETPLDQAFLPMGPDGAMAVAAAAGHAEINVHAGQRDARVKAALLLLKESQNMTEQEIDSAVKECIQYLIANGCNRGLWVLDGPESPNDYGPFFKKIVINGTYTSGQEIIGRLWGFIHTLPEQKKALALYSLVAELDKCVNEDGERICDSGKTQHLFIAVLQGNLNGVHVDDSIEIPKIDQKEGSSSSSSRVASVAESMGLFFAKVKRKEIDELEALLIAAHRFCDKNSRIDREAFIQEIKDYAAASGMQ